MRNLNDEAIDRFRIRTEQVFKDFGSFGDGSNGLFVFPSPAGIGRRLAVIVSQGEGWEHASVSTHNSTPFWEEMHFIKQTIFRPEETVMQLHVPDLEHINVHPYCLHLWRPIFHHIPTPPGWMVG